MARSPGSPPPRSRRASRAPARAAAIEAASGAPPLVGDSEVDAQAARADREVRDGRRRRCSSTARPAPARSSSRAHLHAASRRAEQPFVAVNCAAIPESLIESELFGHAQGRVHRRDVAAARPLRVRRTAARCSSTRSATCALPAQAKLLRALETGEVQADRRRRAARGRRPHRRREPQAISSAEVAAGRFREDLYYRLDVLAIDVPPLRARGDDVLVLAEHVSRRGRRAPARRPVVGITVAGRAALRAYGWPGNVRQLRNEIERAVLLVRGRRDRRR